MSNDQRRTEPSADPIHAIPSRGALRGLLDAVPDAMVVVDGRGEIALVNAHAEELFGYARGELDGKPVEVLVPPRLAAAHVEQRSAYAALPRARPMGTGLDTRAVRRDGTELAVEISLSPVATGEGMLVSSAIRDVSERKQREWELRAKNRELESLCRDVEKLSRLKGNLLADMSHELRTPLNGILGFAELLHGGAVGPVSDTHREYLGDILVSARHLLRIIDDVLDMAKAEAGTLRFHPAPVDLAKLVCEVRDALRAIAAASRIDVEISVDPRLVGLFVDPTRLRQVLYNYLSNALKFTPDGGTVAIRVRPEGPSAFRIEVEDSGAGIAPDDVAHLFERFRQVGRADARRVPGTGLGLAVTREIVEAQGGSVGVESAPGRGSRFWAVLPCIHGR